MGHMWPTEHEFDTIVFKVQSVTDIGFVKALCEIIDQLYQILKNNN